MLISSKAAAFVFFDELSEPEREHYSSLLKPHSIGAIWSAQSYGAWRDIPSTYVVCEKDKVIPSRRQEEMIRNARRVQPRAFDVVERLDTGHDPILTKIDGLVDVVKRATKGDDW